MPASARDLDLRQHHGIETPEHVDVRFELAGQGSETRLVFEHNGFPEGEEEHLTAGWQSNFWGPMTEYLAKQA